MTFMGSPIDARLSPTVTNKLAEEQALHLVPVEHDLHRAAALSGHRAARLSGLRPALQLHVDERRASTRTPTGAISSDLMNGDGDSAEKHLEFYDEYLSVLDLTEEFYLQTIDIVFQQLPAAQGRAGASRPRGATRR